MGIPAPGDDKTMIPKYTKFIARQQLAAARRADKARLLHIEGRISTRAVICPFVHADQVDALDAFTPGRPSELDQVKPRQHRRQHRRQQKQEDEDAGDADPEPDPLTPRALNDRLNTFMASGPSWLVTTRLPHVPAKNHPRYNPQLIDSQAQKIASEWAEEGIAAVICPAFESINKQVVVPHLHSITSSPPSAHWVDEYCEKHGPRAVHVIGVGPTSLDRQKLARYVSNQSVSAIIAAPGLATRSASLEDATEVEALIEGSGDSAFSSSLAHFGEHDPAAAAMIGPQPIQIAAEDALRLPPPRPPPRATDAERAAHSGQTITDPPLFVK